MRHFEFNEDGASKFWEIEQDGVVLHVRWGRIGTAGQSQDKTFADEAAAAKEHSKLIAEKTKKGYAETTATTGTADSTAIPPAADAPQASKPSGKAPSSPKGWKSFSPIGRHFAVAPSGNFIVVGDAPVLVDGTQRMSIAIHRKNGESMTVPVPGAVGGVAVLADERIIVTIAKTYIPGSLTRDYAEAGIVMLDANGALLGRLSDPTFAGAGAIAVDPTGKRIACRATPRDQDHPCYLKSQLFCIHVDAIMHAGAVPQPIEFGVVAALFAFGDDGTLFAIGTGRSLSIDAVGVVHEHTALPGAFTADASREKQLGLSIAGGRHATVGHLDRVVVREGTETRFELPENVCTRALLVEGGKTLVTVAEGVKKRMGRAGEASVPWPDPEPLLREDNIAIWDVETRKLRKALPRASGLVYAVHVVPEQFIAVYTVANKSKVEFFEWNRLLG